MSNPYGYAPKPYARNTAWTDTEKRFDAPMRDILLRAHMEHGSFEKMARALGVTGDTVRAWWQRCALPEFDRRRSDEFTIVICGEVT